MNTKKVFIVVGPESSGTRVITRLLCMAGCIGDYGHKQRLDRFVYEDGIDIPEILEGTYETLVLRRSIPHYPNYRPNILEIGAKFRKAGFDPFYVIIVRDWVCNAKSKVRTRHCKNWQEAEKAVSCEWSYIAGLLTDLAGHFYIISSSCLFINPKRTLKSLEDWTGISFPLEASGIIFDADEKYYNLKGVKMPKKKKYKVEHFDKEFFEGTTGKKGGNRVNVSPEGLGVVRGVVSVLAASFRGKTFLDVGCGVGWFVKFLRELGEKVKGVELSQYAVDKAIASNIVQGDLRDLSHIEGLYDVVFAWNVMAYLVEEDIEKAINSMKRLTRGHLVFGIVTAEVLKELPHGKPGRLTIKPWAWWMEKFDKCGMVQDKELAAKMNKLGGESWNIFCLKEKV